MNERMDHRQFEKIRGVFDRSGIALTLSHIAQPDQPLVLANPKFLEMTGYAESDVVGRNCRFLQHPGDNAEQRAEIREAIASGKEVQVVLRNFRQDGSEFSNLLFLHPIGSGPGPSHYLGSQFVLRPSMQTEAASQRHVHALLQDLSRIGAQTERLAMDHRRHLADAAAALVRAWGGGRR